MNPLAGLQDLTQAAQQGVDVRLSFENKDYVKMAVAIFMGLFLAMVLAKFAVK